METVVLTVAPVTKRIGPSMRTPPQVSCQAYFEAHRWYEVIASNHELWTTFHIRSKIHRQSQISKQMNRGNNVVSAHPIPIVWLQRNEVVQGLFTMWLGRFFQILENVPTMEVFQFTEARPTRLREPLAPRRVRHFHGRQCSIYQCLASWNSCRHSSKVFHETEIQSHSDRAGTWY